MANKRQKEDKQKQELVQRSSETLLKRWGEDVNCFFDEDAVNKIDKDLHDPKSTKRTRFGEYYRLGFIGEKLTGAQGKPRQVKLTPEILAGATTTLGYLMAVIQKAPNLPASTKAAAEDAFCALVCLIIRLKLGDKSWSFNYILHRLLDAFPVQEGYDKYLWCRYVMSAFASEADEVDSPTVQQLVSFLSSNDTSCPEMKIMECTEPFGVRYTIKTSKSIAEAIQKQVSLNSIKQQKLGTYMLYNSKCYFYRAAQAFPEFLKECYLYEGPKQENPFAPLFDEPDEGAKKGSVLETLSEIVEQSESQKLKTEFKKVMDAIINGAQEAIDLLGGAGGAGQGAMRGMNVIYFGPPGTGKSTEILNAIPKIEPVGRAKTIRVTFHPDTDYASFVGCYKPRNSEDKTQIIYEFAPQAFTKAYVEAWKNKDIPHVLVIEELNRGNCAQIFGDIFQLLDRDGNGESKFPITPDQDLQKYLAEQFEKEEGLPGEIKKGEEMKLPTNLYVWATINTSDQSLFPIDSAFKRRWDWRYVPIRNEQKGFYVSIAGKRYDWWAFLTKINEKITSATSSEDKQIGYWFARPSNGDKEISAEDFTYKVLAYLWMDVFKDIDEGSPFFFDDKRHPYSDFSNDKGLPKEETLKDFLAALGVEGQDAPAPESAPAPAPADADASTTAP